MKTKFIILSYEEYQKILKVKKEIDEHPNVLKRRHYSEEQYGSKKICNISTKI